MAYFVDEEFQAQQKAAQEKLADEKQQENFYRANIGLIVKVLEEFSSRMPLKCPSRFGFEVSPGYFKRML